MFCSNCGSKIEEGASECTNCKALVNPNNAMQKEESTFGFAIIGFLIPLVGIILYLVYFDKEKARAKAAGMGALIGYLFRILFSLIYSILYLAFFKEFFSSILESIIDISSSF